MLHLSDAILRTTVGPQDTAAVQDLLFEGSWRATSTPCTGCGPCSRGPPQSLT